MIPKFTIGNIIKQGVIIAINRTGVVVEDPNTQSGRAIEYKDVEFEKLTEEWLLKFGWVQKSHQWNDMSISHDLYWKGKYYIGIHDGYITFSRLHLRDEQQYLTNIKYVSELQNIFYCLTKAELETK